MPARVTPPVSSGGGGGGTTWETIDIGTGAPDYDPNGIWVSTVDEGDGSFTVTHERELAKDGLDNGWSYVADLPAAYDPDLHLLHLRITRLSAYTNSTNSYQGICLADGGGNMPAAGTANGPGFRYAGNWITGKLRRTSFATTTNIATGTAFTAVYDALSTFATTGKYSLAYNTDIHAHAYAQIGAYTAGGMKIVIGGGNYGADTAANVSCTFKYEMGISLRPTS